MAALRELRKRLKSVRATGQLAGAMRTVAAAKFSRANAARTAGEPYAALCRELVALAGAPAPEEPAAGAAAGPRCAVVLSSNRGLCGGFNTELLTMFFERTRAPLSSPAAGWRPPSAARRGFRWSASSRSPTFPHSPRRTR